MSSPILSPAIPQNITPGYMSGFGNSFETEALPGALPIGRNSPQRCAYGLYAEQLSGSPFTAPRGSQRALLALSHPALGAAFRPLRRGRCRACGAPRRATRPSCRSRHCAGIRADPEKGHDVRSQGMRTITTAGDANTQAGMAAHVYLDHEIDGRSSISTMPTAKCCSYRSRATCASSRNSAVIDVEPGEIAIIPRGVKLRVELTAGPARGYVCENYGGAFTLPERGPIGANCLANARDFLTPVAAYEDKDTPDRLYVKWGGRLFVTELDHSPLDVVAWHGNYAPYKYDLRRFSPVGAIGFDHPDPSIFTVLTVALRNAGHRECRLRDLSGALGGGGKHLPPALVSHEHHVGVHGADLRRL